MSTSWLVSTHSRSGALHGPWAACAPIQGGAVVKDQAQWKDATWGSLLTALNFAAGFTGGPCSLDDEVNDVDAMDAGAGNDELSSDLSSLTDSGGSAYADLLAVLSSDSDQDDPSEMAESIAHAAP